MESYKVVSVSVGACLYYKPVWSTVLNIKNIIFSHKSAYNWWF